MGEVKMGSSGEAVSRVTSPRRGEVGVADAG